jgi:hypothetical protein
VLTTERLRGIRLNEIPPGLALTGVLIASAMLLPVRPVLGTAGFLIAGALALHGRDDHRLRPPARR